MHRSRVKYFIEIIIHVLFWFGVYYALKGLTTASYSMVSNRNGKVSGTMAISMLFPYRWIVLGALMILFYSNTFWLFKKVIRYKSDLWRVAVIAGWFMLIFALNYMVIRWRIGSSESIPFPPNMGFLPSPPPFGKPPGDNWSHMQLIMALIFVSVLAVALGNFFIREWVRNDLRRSQVEAHQLSTEIKFLRSQVNPHFLFNTLNNLFSMAQKRGNDDLADGISKLSGMMRYMLYESNTESVPLQREIEYLKNCISLNKLRYADSEVSVTFSHPAPGEIAAAQVAPMLFIPFLENAFKHGVSIGRHSHIAMAITVDAKKLIFSCENTDHSAVKKLEEEKAGIGLENVRRRLELVYPGRHRLQAGPAAGKYTVNLQIELD